MDQNTVTVDIPAEKLEILSYTDNVKNINTIVLNESTIEFKIPINSVVVYNDTQYHVLNNYNQYSFVTPPANPIIAPQGIKVLVQYEPACDISEDRSHILTQEVKIKPDGKTYELSLRPGIFLRHKNLSIGFITDENIIVSYVHK